MKGDGGLESFEFGEGPTETRPGGPNPKAKQERYQNEKAGSFPDLFSNSPYPSLGCPTGEISNPIPPHPHALNVVAR